MPEKPAFDIDHANQYFSTHCFNAAWELLEKRDRTSDDDEQMARLAQASLWHWTQRADCSDENLSIGSWQISRIYAVLGEAGNARKYAQLCLDNAPADDAFCLGYAYEALARAEAIADNHERAKQFLAESWRHSESVTQYFQVVGACISKVAEIAKFCPVCIKLSKLWRVRLPELGSTVTGIDERQQLVNDLKTLEATT